LKNILVLGIGNILMEDDGAGVHAVNKLSAEYEENKHLKLIDGGTLGLDLLNFVEWADILILIDAVDIGESPGTIIKSIITDDLNFKFSKTSHEMDLEDLLFSAKLLNILPEKIVFYGIQIKSVSMQFALSKEVGSKLDELCDYIKIELSNYL
jgi:hydrogenase maturation protease